MKDVLICLFISISGYIFYLLWWCIKLSTTLFQKSNGQIFPSLFICGDCSFSASPYNYFFLIVVILWVASINLLKRDEIMDNLMVFKIIKQG